MVIRAGQPAWPAQEKRGVG